MRAVRAEDKMAMWTLEPDSFDSSVDARNIPRCMTYKRSPGIVSLTVSSSGLLPPRDDSDHIERVK